MRATGWTRGLITLGLGGVLMAGCAAALLLSQNAVAETQQIGTQLSNPITRTTQAGQATKLTPEQEAALVEVRRILREARIVAESIQPPLPVLSDRHRRKALERAKNRLLNEIEEAQLQAGDVAITSTLTGQSKIGFKNSLALAQARYGFTSEAVQTASTETVTGESLLLLVEALVKAGDIPAAIRLAEMQLPRDGVELWRQKAAAIVYSYIAEEQHKVGDVKAHDTLSRAVKEGPTAKFAHTEEYIHALVALARAQAALGDKAAAAETFKRTIDASLAKRRDRDFSGLLKLIAKAQAESGDRTGGEQTFQRAIELRTGPRDLACLAWAQAVTGQRDTALRSFKLAIDDAEKLPVEEQRRALSDLVPWQLEIGDHEGALETVEKARRIGAFDMIGLSGRIGNWKLALELTHALSDDSRKAGALAYITRTLVKTKDPFGTPELITKLSKEASTLLEHVPQKDRSDADHMLKNIAIVQTAAGDLPAAQVTIEKISSILQNGAYSEVVHVLIDKGDLLTAGKVLAELKGEWRPVTDSFRKLGNAYAQSDDKEAGLAFLRQQHNSYEKANGLLGVGEGLMKQHNIPRLWHSQLPRRNFCPDMSKYD